MRVLGMVEGRESELKKLKIAHLDQYFVRDLLEVDRNWAAYKDPNREFVDLVPLEIEDSPSKEFEKDTGEEESLSIAKSILECLLKLPSDLRKVIVSNLIIAGGGAVLPGFTSRLRIKLKKMLVDCHFEPINFDRGGIGHLEDGGDGGSTVAAVQQQRTEMCSVSWLAGSEACGTGMKPSTGQIKI
ncbi:hypothetical protein PPACK8108_LOCUS20865 [Phakopsora pachyrhizi]|uniref:Actin n=1 Tax=Phakopsora pachyrhizi TaxID=170000 RepID=A0AAV0BJS9_PHAPC|nr:hypothetical protein PPACK8108_LOCUS20865 [Phakopsora pachyrhizi]